MRSRARPLLIGESFSPWTKKARWALEHCDLAYGYEEYTPILSEPALRRRLKRWAGTVSVPVLFVEREVFHGSWEIARYADRRAGDGRLGDFDAIAPWSDLSEAALAEGRTRVLRCILGDERALEESLPAFVPGVFRRPLRFLSRDVVRRLDRKYAHLSRPGALRDALDRAREGLSRSDGDYLLGRFSYADICTAAVLEVVSPIARAFPPLGPATRSCWNDSALADEFRDLLSWRDRLARADSTSYSQLG